ncbi:MAG: alkaline phosphatase family protein [Mucilaginibacter sp.]
MKILSLFIVSFCIALQLSAQHKTKNIVIVTIDGLRWQEFYRGADTALINSKFTDDKDEVRKRFAAKTIDDNRTALLPFVWKTVAQKGQLYGDRDSGNKDEVANPYHFSYPGYNEIFTGFPDVRMNTNDGITNPNMNVLEFINQQKGFENKVAVFSSWERFPDILNVKRSHLLVNSGYMDFTAPDAGERLKYLNELQKKAPHYLGDSTRIDFLTYEFGKEYLKQYKPRVLYIAFDEPDDMAHGGNYKFYLDRVHQEDSYIQELWQYLQTDPQYKDKTTLIITCDHGRGDEPLEKWRDHGSDVVHSEQTWFAVIGPDTPPTGVIRTPTTTYHKQLAQTIATLLGFDFQKSAGHEVGDGINTVTSYK